MSRPGSPGHPSPSDIRPHGVHTETLHLLRTERRPLTAMLPLSLPERGQAARQVRERLLLFLFPTSHMSVESITNLWRNTQKIKDYGKIGTFRHKISIIFINLKDFKNHLIILGIL